MQWTVERKNKLLKHFKALLPKGKVEESYLNAFKIYLKNSPQKRKLIEIVLKSYLNASGLYLKASLERDRFPVEKVQTRIMSPPSVRLGQPGKHQIVSKSGNLEIFFRILRQFGDVLKMLEMFWRCLGCALQEYFASGSGNVRNFRMQQVSSYETLVSSVHYHSTYMMFLLALLVFSNTKKKSQ